MNDNLIKNILYVAIMGSILFSLLDAFANKYLSAIYNILIAITILEILSNLKKGQ